MAKKQLIALLSLFFAAISFAADDPTAPLGWVQPKAQIKSQEQAKNRVPELQSIVCRGEVSCYAILNNTVVKKGQKVAGYQVKEITSEQVTVIKGGKSWRLALFALNIKK